LKKTALASGLGSATCGCTRTRTHQPRSSSDGNPPRPARLPSRCWHRWSVRRPTPLVALQLIAVTASWSYHFSCLGSPTPLRLPPSSLLAEALLSAELPFVHSTLQKNKDKSGQSVPRFGKHHIAGNQHPGTLSGLPPGVQEPQPAGPAPRTTF
jgi:hypothetical protein